MESNERYGVTCIVDNKEPVIKAAIEKTAREELLMENVAEITQAETEEKEGAKYITVPEDELQAMLQAAAKEAIKELRKEEAKEKKKNKYHDTFSLMRCYRDAVFHIENAVSEGTQLELEGMTEEQQETYLRSVRRTRFKTLLMTANIDKAIEEMARRRKAAGRELEYQVFDMYFMQGMNYEQIIDQVEQDTGEKLGKNTPRRWVTGIINEMSVLLWGLEDERQ